MNKKGDMEPLAKVILWIVFFMLLAGGVYFLFQKLGVK